MVVVIALVLLAIIIAELVAIARHEPPKEFTVTHTEVSDPWIVGLYPPEYAAEKHRDEPRSPWTVEPHLTALFRGEPLSDEGLDALVIDAAFELEFRARRVFADRQFRGILRGRHTIVWSYEGGARIRRVLERRRDPSPAARAHLDRALAWWGAARRAGTRIYEWDRPGYDDVTSAFEGLEGFAAETVSIDSDEHGVAVRTWEETRRPRDPGVPPARVRRILAALAGLVLVIGLDLRSANRHRHSPPPPPKSCAEQRAEILADIDKLLARGTASAPALAELRPLVEAGQDREAEEHWHATRGEEPAEVLLDTKLFLLSVCAPRDVAIDPG